MASIHKVKRSPYWHCAYLGPNGRRVLRTTEQEDRDAALAMCVEFARMSKLASRGELTRAVVLEVAESLVKRTDTGENFQTVTIADFFRDWIATKETVNAPGTATRYNSSLKGFLAHLGPRASKPLTALTARDVEQFLEARVKSGWAPNTVRGDVVIIRTALNAARKKGLILANVAEAVELPKARGVEREAFTPAEVDMLLNAARGEWYTLILLAYHTGARQGDCARMTWDSVNLSDGTLTYTQSKTGKAIHDVPLNPDLLEHLLEISGIDKPISFILPGMAHLKSGGTKGLSNAFKRIMHKAGVDTRTAKGKGNQNFSKRSFHSLRHSCINELAKRGVPEGLRMLLTGHTSKATHHGYTHPEAEERRAAINLLPRITAVYRP